MKERIHIFGASGSGTTTIAEMAGERLGYTCFDADNYFWLQTDNPFTVEREREQCLKLMRNDLAKQNKWILSGSIADWGNTLIPYFDLVVFVYVPPDIRLERLKKRECVRYGDEILVGGTRYKESNVFLDWAASYDEGTGIGRSLEKHETWLKNIECPTVRIINNVLDDSVNAVINVIKCD